MEPEQAAPSAASQLPARRTTALLKDGAYLFEDELIGGSQDAIVITCTAWLLELYELRTGNMWFHFGDDLVGPTTRSFGVFYPPFSLTRPCFKKPFGRVIGIAASDNIPEEFAKSPCVFETNRLSAPASAQEAIAIMVAGSNRRSVESSPAASLLSIKARKLIYTNHLNYPAIARIASRLGVSHAHLSRQFKSDFGMSPSEYLRRLRVADAPLRLARGEEIIRVSQDVGYNDLSRFYKQFRKTTNTSPGVCKTLLRPPR